MALSASLGASSRKMGEGQTVTIAGGVAASTVTVTITGPSGVHTRDVVLDGAGGASFPYPTSEHGTYTVVVTPTNTGTTATASFKGV